MNLNEYEQSAVGRGERVRRLRGLANLTRDELAEKAGQLGEKLSSATLRHWEEGKGGGLTRKGAVKLVKLFGLLGIQTDINWLEQGFGASPTYIGKRQDSSSAVPVEAWQLSNTADAALQIQKETELFLQSSPLAFTAMVLDDAMLPLLRMGDTVGGYARYGEDIHTILNEDCLIETEDHLILCRRLLPGRMEGCYHLNCINPNTSSMPFYEVKLIRAAPVIWIRRQEQQKLPK